MKNTHGAIQAASTATGRYHPALVAQYLVLGCHQKSWVCQQNRAEGSPDFSAALGPLPSRVRSLPLIYTCPVVSVIPQLTAQKALPLHMPLCWSWERSQLVLQLQEQGPSGLQPWHCSLLCPWDLELPSLPHCLETMATGIKRETWHQQELSLGTRGRPAYVLPL